jgi:demethylmenaquinone methyltransferase / 2-methoxy-6-polyprenyl-1,4-benzoquinol methylase
LIPFRKPGEKERYVWDMFSRIANSYDLTNTILSLGLDRYWRRRTVELMSIHPGDSVLDVACGTGMLLLEEARVVGIGGSVTGADFCQPMLDIARHNIAHAPYADSITLVNANALALPFPSDSFAAASIGFALRNVPDIPATIAEMARVVRPGGKVVSLEVAKPTLPIFRNLFFLHFNHIVPIMGRLLSGSDEAYRYLPQSLAPLPSPEAIRGIFTAVGLRDAQYVKLSGGMVTVHVGTV